MLLHFINGNEGAAVQSLSQKAVTPGLVEVGRRRKRTEGSFPVSVAHTLLAKVVSDRLKESDTDDVGRFFVLGLENLPLHL